jgi:hypothetical protein
VIWNIEEGLKLTVEQLEKAEAQRVAMTARTLEFFEKYDLLLAPATIVPPFPVENRYVAECAGKKFDNYVESRHRLCDHAGVLPGIVAAMRVHRLGSSGGAAGRRPAAWRGATAGGCKGAGGYFGRARDDTNRSKGAEVNGGASSPSPRPCGIETSEARS